MYACKHVPYLPSGQVILLKVLGPPLIDYVTCGQARPTQFRSANSILPAFTARVFWEFRPAYPSSLPATHFEVSSETIDIYLRFFL